MQRVEIAVPDDLAEDFAPYGDRLDEVLRLGLRQVRVQEALLRYGRGEVSLARAAELAGLSRTALIRQARAAGVEPRWSEAVLREELT